MSRQQRANASAASNLSLSEAMCFVEKRDRRSGPVAAREHAALRRFCASFCVHEQKDTKNFASSVSRTFCSIFFGPGFGKHAWARSPHECFYVGDAGAGFFVTILLGHEEKHFHASPSVNRLLTRRIALCPHKKEEP